MPSSISSSEREPPAGRWGATWLLAVAIALGLTVGFEQLARRHGQRPSVVDDPVSWALARRSVDSDRRVVAFVGTSRMLLAYAPAAFRAAAPELRGVQLAINGIPAVEVLADLAADELFRGVAVVDVDEWDIAAGDVWHAAEPYVVRSHALWRAPGALANRYLAGLAQERVALLAPGGRHIVTLLGRGKSPQPTTVVAERDRSSHGDYSLAPPGALEVKAAKRLTNFDEKPPSPDDWVARALALDTYVQQIRSHGGEVVFVRPPVSGRLAAGFAQHYPRAQYWDAFAARTTAQTIHFLDVPAMRDLTCPDEMHLDQTTQGTFTRALVETIRARGVFAGR